MLTLPPALRRALRARAHHLHPVVTIGHHGLTPAVAHEIDVALSAHELVKVRVFGDDRRERDALLARICDDMGCGAVQRIGKLLVLWRPRPAPAAADESPRPRKAVATVRHPASPAAASRRRRTAVSARAQPSAPPATPRRAPPGKAPAGVPRAAAPRRRRARGNLHPPPRQRGQG
ncbi:MAG TPA: YhbY family RNA-binding protein [Casimicrobiaceae bacterium]